MKMLHDWFKVQKTIHNSVRIFEQDAIDSEAHVIAEALDAELHTVDREPSSSMSKIHFAIFL